MPVTTTLMIATRDARAPIIAKIRSTRDHLAFLFAGVPSLSGSLVFSVSVSKTTTSPPATAETSAYQAVRAVHTG